MESQFDRLQSQVVDLAAELAAMTDTELDEVVARVVLGWRKRRGLDYQVTHGGIVTYGWTPTTEWAHTGIVIERMLKRGADISLYSTAARVRPAPELRSLYVKPAATTIRAICEAAVLATQSWRKARKGKSPAGRRRTVTP